MFLMFTDDINYPILSYSLFIDNLDKMLISIIKKYELPEHSLYLYSNISARGTTSEKETSKSICIFEPEYPPKKKITKPSGKNFIILNFKRLSDSSLELLIRNEQYEAISLPDSANIKPLKSDKTFKHIIFDTFSKTLYNYLYENILYCLRHYESSSSFGCCSHFIECSDNRSCVHTNKLYAKGCMYRTHLDSGKIFYVKNKNIQ